jgi:flagellin
LNANNAAAAKSLQKLSSGLRINSAADDAAGLAISEKMRGQISGLDQASRNAQDGISLIQTAEGALNETQSILQRMRELAVQASNDTNTDSDRTQMQKELDQLTAEVTRISADTQFNTKNLLDGSMGNVFAPTVTSATLQNLQATGANLTTGVYTLSMTAAGTDTFGSFNSSLNAQVASTDLSVQAGAHIKYGSYSLSVTNYNGAGHTADLSLIGPDGTQTVLAGQDVTSNVTIGGVTIATGTHNITQNGVATFTLTDNGLDVDLTAAANGNTVNAAAIPAYAGQSLSVGGFQFSLTTNHGANGTVVTGSLTNNSVTFQIGANAGQNTTLSISSMSAQALGIQGLDISTQVGANAAITTIDNANNAVSTERANLGAMQNRLEHTINNLGTTSQNLTASESQIRDVDMASEMMDYTKNNILSQAATAMLAQANQAPQEILQLLK